MNSVMYFTTGHDVRTPIDNKIIQFRFEKQTFRMNFC